MNNVTVNDFISKIQNMIKEGKLNGTEGIRVEEHHTILKPTGELDVKLEHSEFSDDLYEDIKEFKEYNEYDIEKYKIEIKESEFQRVLYIHT